MNILYELQKNIHAPKDKKNTFGNYNYRTAEGILAVAKSVMPEGVSIVLSDDVIEIGGHVFVKAKATLKSGSDVIAESFGFAGHPLDKKGMDFSQITGASSSYARKYALQGLFALDDSSADPDVTNKHETDTRTKTAPAKTYVHFSPAPAADGTGPKVASDKQKGMISILGKKLPPDVTAKIKADFKIMTIDQWNSMTSFTASKIIEALQNAEKSPQEHVLDDEIPY
jgi:hypothetical protein